MGIISGLSSCKGNKPVDHKDSIEYAVYAVKPIDDPEDCEPLYIPIDILGAYEPGDTALSTDNYQLVEFAIRDAETKQPIMDGLHRVIIQERLNYNKWFKAGGK